MERPVGRAKTPELCRLKWRVGKLETSMLRRNFFIPVAIGRNYLTNHLVPAFDPVDCQISMQADFTWSSI